MNDTPELDWQSRRNRFNHDWLKNQYLLALAKFRNILDDRIDDDEFVKDFLDTGIQAWERELPEALELIEQFATSMSPRVLFTRTPFSKLPNRSSWLPNLTEALWQNNHQIDAQVTRAHDAATAANRDFAELMAQLEQAATIDELLQDNIFSELFSSFRVNCTGLAEALASFPNRILVS